MESIQSGLGLGPSRDASISKMMSRKSVTPHDAVAMGNTKIKETVPFQRRAVPRKAQKNHRLFDGDTLSATVDPSRRPPRDTGRERFRMGNNRCCSTNALALSSATRSSLACSFGLSRQTGLAYQPR